MYILVYIRAKLYAYILHCKSYEEPFLFIQKIHNVIKKMRFFQRFHKWQLQLTYRNFHNENKLETLLAIKIYINFSFKKKKTQN